MTETSKFWIRNNVKNSNWWWNYRCCFLNVTINPTKWIFARQLVLPWSCIWTTVPLSGHSVRFTSLLHWSCTASRQNAERVQHSHSFDVFTTTHMFLFALGEGDYYTSGNDFSNWTKSIQELDSATSDADKALIEKSRKSTLCVFNLFGNFWNPFIC